MVQLIAFYLPQYHPIPENDGWWGRGFTEWTNVTKSTPLFTGHYQPHLPSELGFYDLRVKQSRLDQVDLAKAHGIDAFCFHYYWFSGKRLLFEPVDAFLSDPDHEMGFCLNWANENWTRRWDAAEHEVLIAQSYEPGWEVPFIDSVIPAFRDRRYVRLDGKPLFLVYRPQHMPDSRAALDVWRRRCRQQGIGEVHFACALVHGNQDYERYGFDSGVEFPPHNVRAPNVSQHIEFQAEFVGHVFRYEDVVRNYLGRDHQGRSVHRTVFPSWDNAARTGRRALIILNGTPENYEYWLSEAVADANNRGSPFVFINAWNEWAEGCHLEPDRRHGRAFLEATLRAKTAMTRITGIVHTGIPSEAAGRAPRTFAGDLRKVLQFHFKAGAERMKSALRRYPLLHAFVITLRNGLRSLSIVR